MKNLILILTVAMFIVTYSLPSYSEWTKVGKNASGMIFYVGFERIKKMVDMYTGMI